jgi:enterochelin esterase-like enzyme
VFLRRTVWLWLCVGVCFSWVSAQAICNDVGTTTRESYYSAWLGQEMVYSIYLPPCYDASQTYPIVYLFHGSNDDDGHWGRLGLIDELNRGIVAGDYVPMLVVLPFGNVIANRNRFDSVSWSNIFLTELMPDAKNKYPAIRSNPQDVAIGGISRGGFWAYQIGLRHPDLFGTIGGHSAFFDLYHAEAQDNPLDLILNAPTIENMRLWLDRGIDDYAQDGLDIMAERMTQRGLAHTYQIYPSGEHNNDYWREHIAEYVQFYNDGFVRNIAPIATPIVGGFATNTPIGTSAPVSAFATATPILSSLPTVTASATQKSQGVWLVVPVVAFPSLQTSITRTELDDILAGKPNNRLIIDNDLPQQLIRYNVSLAPNIQTVPTQGLRDALWNNRESFALVPFVQVTTQMRVLWVDDAPIFDDLANYPLAFSSDTPNFDPQKFTRLTLSGVTALTRNTQVALEQFGIAHATSGIQAYVNQSDFFHMSNEVSFAMPCPNLGSSALLGGATSFCSLPAHFDLLTTLGVDMVELTGNHNADYGYQAYRDTYQWYQDKRISTLGGGTTLAQASAPLIIDYHGTRIAWVACNAAGPYYALINTSDSPIERLGAMPCDAINKATITALKQTHDVVIVTLQQIEVEDYVPLNEQYAQFRAFIDAGADFVAGTAAHKPQIFEFYGDGFIHYGMGNLFFDQPFWGNMRFFMDTLLLYDGKLMSVELFPGIIDDNVRPRLMTAEERQNFLFFMFREQNGF